MPLQIGDEKIITAHASKKSKVNLKLFEAHTSVLIPFMALPLWPKLITVQVAAVTALILILLERRGWTLGIALKRMRTRLAGKHHHRKTRADLIRRMRG